MVFADMCEKLYDLNAKLEIVPQLAAALPTFSADKKTVTIKIRTGIKFNDGTTARRRRGEAVARSRPDPEGLGARERALAGRIDRRRRAARPSILHLKTRYSPITAQLADRAGMIMSPKALNALGDKFATNPVCVGPFMYKDRVAPATTSR